MLAIFMSDGSKPIAWHVGEPKPVKFENYNKVVQVQADGHELTYIEHKISNIPLRLNGKVVNWFGDHAKFIVANLVKL